MRVWIGVPMSIIHNCMANIGKHDRFCKPIKRVILCDNMKSYLVCSQGIFESNCRTRVRHVSGLSFLLDMCVCAFLQGF